MKELNFNTEGSQNFRKQLELIKKEGTEPFKELISDMENIKFYNFMNDAIFDNYDQLLALTKKNKQAVKILREYNDLFESYIGSFYFGQFIYLIKNMDVNKIDAYIEKARKLEDLKISRLKFGVNISLDNCEFRSQLIFNNAGKITDLIKHYSDGEIEYLLTRIKDMVLIITKLGFVEEYAAIIQKESKETNRPNPTWVIQALNHEYGRQVRNFYATSLDFNSDKLPDLEDLNSYEIPQKLSLYRKSI